MSKGNGRLIHGDSTATIEETSLLLWFVYHQDRAHFIRALGLDATERESVQASDRHVVIVTGAGDLYAFQSRSKMRSSCIRQVL